MTNKNNNLDKKYLPIYKTFYEVYKTTGDKFVRFAFATVIGELKELSITGASVEAIEAAKKLGEELQQQKYGTKRYLNKHIICEHHLPKRQVMDELLGMPEWDDKEALAILSKCHCYWITRDEDKKLKQKKWAIKRPNNAYETLGIDIINFD